VRRRKERGTRDERTESEAEAEAARCTLHTARYTVHSAQLHKGRVTGGSRFGGKFGGGACSLQARGIGSILNLWICLFCPSIYLSVYLSISTYLSIYLSIVCVGAYP
jgi:hypothetical protein